MKSFVRYCKAARKILTTNHGKKAWRALIKEVLILHLEYSKT